MMKWGRRKPSSASSSRPSFMSHVSPLSWLSKFKQMRVNSEPNPGNLKQKGMQNALSVSCSPQYACGNGGRFYGGDDDAFCRLSFGDESHVNKKSKEILKSAESSLDNKHVIPSSSCHSGKWHSKKSGRKEGTLKFKEKDIGLKEERNLAMDTKIPMEMDEYNREKEIEKLRRKFERKAQRVLREQILKLEREEEAAEIASNKSVQKDVLQLESPRTIWTPRKHSFAPSIDSKNSSLRAIREDCVFSTGRFEKTNGLFEEKLGSGGQDLKQIEELKAKTDKQRQSLHVSREKQRRKPKHIPKVRVHSPRMASKVEICKIKALEDLRKAKLKKKKEKEKVVEETADLDTFAVVKRSLNPQQDFRDSMIEMITERHISQPEEMEELLACYLTLNSDEYHDLIIKVFRQVWFDMNPDSVGIKLDKHFCYDQQLLHD